MAAMFPNSEGDAGALTRDGFVTFIAETRKDIQYLTQAIKDLKASVEEMVDRFESDAEDLRKSLGGLVELRNGHSDLGRRIAEVESSAKEREKRISALEQWQTQEKAWMAAIGFFGGLLGSLIYFLAGKIWK